MSVSTNKMQAVYIEEYGGPEVASYKEVTRPQPGEGELLVKVHASSVNPVDWKTIKGYLAGAVKLPLIPGWDVAGTIEALGAEAGGFEIGEPVYAMIHVRGGAYAEYAVVKQAEVARKPATLNYEQAAGVPLAALTAWQTLFDAAKITSGQRVLIHAASGGVGTFAVQLAHNAGAKVIATTSGANVELVQSLGADEVIDYRSVRFDEAVEAVDVVLDTLGGETLKRSYRVVKPGGSLISIVEQPDQNEAASQNIQVFQVGVKPNPLQLTQIAELLDQGKLQIVVSNILPISQVQQALQLSQAGHIRGKLVLKVL